MIYTLKTKYKHLTQKWDFCGATCLQMILFRHDIWQEQEDIAFTIETHIKPEHTNRFSHPFPAWNPWLRIMNFKGEIIQNYLSHFGFLATVYKYSDFKSSDFEEKVIESLRNDGDMMIAFHRGEIDPEKNHGHYVLLSEYNSDTKIITVCDPTPKTKNFWEVNIEVMYNHMSAQRDRERGIVIIKSM